MPERQGGQMPNFGTGSDPNDKERPEQTISQATIDPNDAAFLQGRRALLQGRIAIVIAVLALVVSLIALFVQSR